MSLRFTSDPNLIGEVTRTLKVTERNLDEWTTEYLDTVNQERWRQVYVETDYHGGGHPVLMKLPEPSQSELITIALKSHIKDEVATAAALLNYNERDLGFSFREELIKHLEDHTRGSGFAWTEMERWRIPMIIQECDLADGVNRRPIVGKKDDEIETDFRYFQDIAGRALKLINAAK